MSIKKQASAREYSKKQSYKDKLCYQAKIILALKGAKEPLSESDLARRVCGEKFDTTRSSVYTNLPILIEKGLVKEISGKYSLWTFEGKPTILS
jgi:Fe2+ or Zn2+ uptake regulation protein